MTFLITFSSAEMLWGKSDLSLFGAFRVIQNPHDYEEQKKKKRQTIT